MAWDEWEEIKAASAERHSTPMRLNHLPGDFTGSPSKGVSGTLRHTNGPWGTAANTADDLKTSTESVKKGLRSSHTGVSTGAAGLASLGALKTVLSSWEKRLEAVRDECTSLEPKMRAVARDMGETDVAVADKARAVHVAGGGNSR
ncbi:MULTISPECIES: hypothetical protein [Streptomyces]|uniref:Amino acid ABC transporter permease n=1 Tax=Streptomyces griseofuscus TaxID=146922 RepID=A0A7H1Q5E4_9ACTN|nr:MULTISPECIES: hypothetical protein [Streptomyces]MBA9045740.1 hypothetical protein [Streptomyces murinus]QNT95524.1 hypothetical protein HEP81_05268 [Streptomyces griseofuscus]